MPAAGGVELWTVGLQEKPLGKGSVQLIDHIVHSKDLILDQPKPKPKGGRCVGIFPKQDLAGEKLSDHNGVWVNLKRA